MLQQISTHLNAVLAKELILWSFHDDDSNTWQETDKLEEMVVSPLAVDVTSCALSDSPDHYATLLNSWLVNWGS